MKLIFSILLLTSTNASEIILSYEKESHAFRFTRNYLKKRLPKKSLSFIKTKNPCKAKADNFVLFHGCITSGDEFKILKVDPRLGRRYEVFMNGSRNEK